MSVTSTEPAAQPTRPPTRDRHGTGRRVVAMGIWAVLFAAGWKLIGLPTDPAYAFIWLWAVTIAWHSDRPWRAHLGFVRDWIPVVLLLEGYNLSRGYADDNGTPHAMELVAADERMWGWLTGGEVPTLWLQHHLYSPAHIRWYDVAASFVYFSHFVTALIVAVVLWLRKRERWAAFVRRWFTLSALGLATYFVYPAAPPWWAAQYGLIEPVARISTRGWQAIGLHGAGNVLNAAQLDAANPVAAMPSLHTAYALFIVAFFLPVVRRRWWPLLLAYPLAMTFTLVYSGEHYMIDVLVGWAYVGVTYTLVGLAEWGYRRYRARRLRPG
jgi:hypothetical protein